MIDPSVWNNLKSNYPAITTALDTASIDFNGNKWTINFGTDLKNLFQTAFTVDLQTLHLTVHDKDGNEYGSMMTSDERTDVAKVDVN